MFRFSSNVELRKVIEKLILIGTKRVKAAKIW